jgi:lipid II:glycine glycyltransferase (peptidoglycan interpeptide bridge formation enzyme)
LNAEALRELVEALRKECVQSKGYALRILPNAFTRTPRAEMFTSSLEQAGFRAARKFSVYRTLVLDLSPTLDELRRQLDPKWRNQLNQAERNNLSISEGSDPQLWDAFETLYCDMMARKRFETTISIKEFAAIQKTLPPELKMQVFICKRDGVPMAGLVCSFLGDAGIYLLGATNEMALKLRAANLLQWTAVKKLKQEGFRYYDLGGIDPVANPGGFHFKQGLSGQDLSQLPAFDCYRSVSQRWMLKVAFGAADLLRVWKIWRHKKEVSSN